MTTQFTFALRRIAYGLRRIVSPPPRPTHGEVWLHLGCGRIDKPGFINIDAFPRRHIHHVQAIDDLRRFADQTVDYIYVSHALEHFPHREVPRVLAEWFRVLRPGGRLCLAVPNFERLLQIYEENGRDLDCILAPLMGGQEYLYDFHYSAFNRRRLEALLRAAGFSSVEDWIPGSDDRHDFNDWSRRPLVYSGKAYPISLNLEAVR